MGRFHINYLIDHLEAALAAFGDVAAGLPMRDTA
jgi:hypothetical protein